jgi:hypothetical protein
MGKLVGKVAVITGGIGRVNTRIYGGNDAAG